MSFIRSLFTVGLLLLLTAAWALPVRVTVPRQGLLSLGIYDASGKLVRSLAYARPVEAGAQTFEWDGANDLGAPVAPGTYQVRGVSFPAGPSVKYLMKVGLSGTPPYATPDGGGEWGGNLGAPADICSNGRQMVGIFQCVESNYCTGIQLMDATGKILRRYFSFFPWDVRYAGAMDEQHFYLALANLGEKRLVVAQYDLDAPRGKILADLPGGDATMEGRWQGRWTTDVRGMAVANGRLYVPVLPANTLSILDTANGKILRAVPIPSPRGIAVHDGQFFLLSGQRLLRLDADGNILATVIAAGLDDPNDLAIDAAGNFYISDGMTASCLPPGRPTAQQVKVFSAHGKLLRTIGIVGGRSANGRYNPNGMLNPRGLCFGPDGNLWVAEDEERFQRLSVWNPVTGALVKDFFNTRISSGQGQLSPDRSQMLFSNDVFADAPGICGYAIDWKTNSWRPAWSYDLPYDSMAQGKVFRGFLHGGYPLLANSAGENDPRFGGGWPYLSFAGAMVKGNNGHTYLTGGEGSIWLFDDTNRPPKLAALVYTHRVNKSADGARYEGDYDQGPNNWLSWSDRNGDGKMTMEGCTLTQDPPVLEQTMRLFAWQLLPDLSIAMLCPRARPDRTLDWFVCRLPVKEVLPSGVPVYDWSRLTDVTPLHACGFAGGDGWKGGTDYYLHGLNVHDGVIDTFAEPWTTAKLRLPGIDGDGWWASRNWRQTPLRFDAKTGEQLGWVKLGRRAPGRAKAGEMYFPRMATAVDHFLFVPDTFAQMWVWTDTGLYLGKLYHDQWEGIYDANSIFVELTDAFVYKIAGKYYACAGDHGVSVHELTLPELTPVTGAPLQVTQEMAKSITPWDPDGPMPDKKPVYIARSLYDYQEQRLVRTITMAGVPRAAEWGDIPALLLRREGVTVAEVRAVWDPNTLYLAYTVHDTHGMKNAGTELPYSPFVSGSYVDFCLGTDWATPNREQNYAGDVRVLLAKITGAQPRDFQLGYWPIKPGGQHPMTIKSPAASRAFDDIAPIDGLSFAMQPTADGYTLVVSVPWKSLGCDPSTTRTLGFDASVAFANAAGTLRTEALHWAGQSESTVVDRPGAAALLPATWGTLSLDRTPVSPARQ